MLPGELFAKRQTSFYADPSDAVFRAFWGDPNRAGDHPSGTYRMIEVKPLFQLRANVDPPQIIDGPLGQRWFIPVTGGSLSGDRISGVAQAGGSDFQLIRKDGVAELDVRVTLLTDDGVTIQLKGHGIRHTTPEVLARIMSGAEVDPAEYYFREALFFEAPVGKYDWLNRIIAIAKGGRLKSHVLIDAYEVL